MLLSKTTLPEPHQAHQEVYKDILDPPKISEKIFWFFGAGLLLLSNYKYQDSLNIFYRGFLVMTVLTSIFTWKIWRLIFSIYMLWIWVSLGVITIFAWTEFGDRVGLTAYVFARAIPMFFLGFSVSREPFGRFVTLGALVLGYTLSSLHDIFIFHGLAGTSFTREQMALMMIAATASIDQRVQNYIYYFPAISYVCILGLGLMDYSNRLIRVTFLGSLAIMISAVIMSTWTASFIVLIIGGILVLFLLLRRLRTTSLFNRIILFCIVGFFIYLIFNIYVLFYAGSTGGGDTAKFVSRFTGILDFLTNPSEYIGDLNKLTGYRIELAIISIEGFLSAPLIGVGDFFYDFRIGGHSFWFDTFARYGLIGGIPLTLMFFSWVLFSYRNWRYSSWTYTNLATLTFFITLSIANLLNPYIFTSSIDFITFYAAGLVVGTHTYSTAVRYS
jgi:hypothetical protein